MSYSEKSWAAAFRVAEENLKRRGKETKKAAKKIWGNNLQVGAMEYMAEEITKSVISGYNEALQALEQQRTQAQQEQSQAEAEAQEEAHEAPEEAAQPSEEDDSEE